MRLLSFLSLATFLLAWLPGHAAEAPFASRDQIQSILDDLLLDEPSLVMVVGTWENNQATVVTAGKTTVPLDGDSVFEIGSITKVFTGILLAQAVQKGTVNLEDPIEKYLPKDVKVPSRSEKKIKVVHLSNHHSSLPRLPANFKPKDPNNPYADYTVQQMYDALSEYKLTRDPGEKWDYSNLGVGLLGHLLTRQEKTTYESLVTSSICDPLEMKDTRVVLNNSMKKRLVPGKGPDGKTVANWDLSEAFAGAGALRSTANDFILFIRANLQPPDSNLGKALRKAQEESVKGMGLGWLRQGGRLLHDGGTGGYCSFVMVDPSNQRGIVVFAAQAGTVASEAASYIMTPSKKPTRVTVGTKILSEYEGEYELVPGVMISITRQDKRLLAKLTGQDAYPIFPESESKFFYKVVPAKISFTRNKDGKVEGLVLHQNGDKPAKKVR